MDAKPKLEDLFEEWAIYKKEVKIAQEKLLDVESDIYEQCKNLLKEEGTTNIGPMKIVTGYNEKWNQDMISSAFDIYQKTGLNTPFGFKTEFKAVKKELAECDAGFYETYIAPALTLTPKKPSFSLKGEE